MKRLFRIAVTVFLVCLAAAAGLAIASLSDWGGRIETMLLVFGDRVWVTLDASRPRVLLLYVIPTVFACAAYSLRAWRRGD